MRAVRLESLEERRLLATVMHSGDIMADETWSGADVHVLTTFVTVKPGATLTIEPGAVVKPQFTGLTIEGVLDARGTAANRIIFTSYLDDTAGGDTNGDGSASAAANNQLGRLSIAPAGTATLAQADIRYGVEREILLDGGTLTMTDVTVRNGAGTGLRIQDSDPTLTRVTFTGNSGPAISMDLKSNPAITAPVAVGNQANGLQLDGGTISQNAVWDDPEIVYVMNGPITVAQGVTLTLGAGQIIKTQNADVGLTVEGTLDGNGSAAEKIAFTSLADDALGGDTNGDGAATVPANNQLGRLMIASTGAATLEQAAFHYGVEREILVDGGTLTLTDVTVRDGANVGLRIQNSDPVLTRVTFSGNLGAAVTMDLKSDPEIVAPIAMGNGVNGLLLDGGALVDDRIWDNPEMVYVLNGAITVPQNLTLTIAAGQMIKPRGADNFLAINGSLEANGTIADPVLFTSFADDTALGDTNGDGAATAPAPGQGSVVIVGATGAADLEHVEMRLGFDGQLRVNGGQAALTNSSIHDGSGVGIYVASGGMLTAENNLLSGHINSDAVNVSPSSSATLVNNTIDGNLRGLFIDSGSATLTNNLITFNSDSGIRVTLGTPVPAMSFNTVYNPQAGLGNYVGLADQTGQNQNLSFDPRYFNRASRQYQLRAGSRAIDSATSDDAPLTDRVGNPRFDDPLVFNGGGGAQPFVDRGAFERQEESTSLVDLASTTISGLASGVQGDMATVNWTVQNVGSETAIATWADAIYLSPDPVWSPDDVLVQEVPHASDLGPGQMYSASASVTLPGVLPGDYYWLVRANAHQDVFEGLALRNNVRSSEETVAMDLPALTVGTPLNGSLPSSGAVRFYKLAAPAAADLKIDLSGSANFANELYIRFGDLPSRQAFDERRVRPNQAAQSVSLSDTRAGNYYVMVYGANVPFAEDFTLSASLTGFSISGIEPARGSNTGEVTVAIRGAQFDGESQVRLIDSAGGTLDATQVYFTDSGLISATFDLTGLPAGLADVQVVNTGNIMTTFPDGFNIVTGQPGRLVTNLITPGRVRVGRNFDAYLEYTNAGDTDLLAPILRLDGSGFTSLSLFPDRSEPGQTFSLVATNPVGPAGVLPPGARGRIHLYGHANTLGDETLRLFAAEYPDAPIDWQAIEPEIRPAELTNEDWSLLFAELQANLGNEWDGFRAAIAVDATLLPPAMGMNFSLNDVFQLEIARARANLNPSIAGRLFLGDASRPLGNVEITLHDPTLEEAFGAVTLTDGSFLVPEVVAGTFEISLGGYVKDDTPLTVGADDLSDVEIVASAGGVISGAVALDPDGSPLRDLAVTAVSEDGQAFSATTGTDGSFFLDSLPAGAYTVSAGADNTTRVARGVMLADGEVRAHVNFALARAGFIQGHVSGPGGPLAQASVSALGEDGSIYSAITDEAGGYQIVSLSAQTYRVVSTAPGLVQAGIDGVVVAEAATVSNVNLSLVAGGGIQGVVTSTVDGAPVSSVIVTFENGATRIAAQTAEDGSFSIDGLPAGNYTTTTLSNDYQSLAANAAVVAGASANMPLAVVPRGHVSGTVTNQQNGQPIAKIIVYAARNGDTVAATVTDAAGAYQIDGLDSGDYEIVVGDTAPGIKKAAVTVDATHTVIDQDFAIPFAGKLSGRVFEADGTTPMEGATVGLVMNNQVVVSMSTNALGEYAFVVVAPGTYQLEAGAADQAFPIRTGLVVTGGGDQLNLDFVAGASTIRGTVTDATSSLPVENATVTISRTDANVAGPAVAFLTTDAAGQYEFAHATPGSYDVLVRAAGHAYAKQNIVVSGAGPFTANVALLGESSMQGLVRDEASSAPIENAVVVLSSTSDPPITTVALTDASGMYDLRGIAPGDFTLTIFAEGFETIVIRDLILGQATRLLDAALAAASTSLSGLVTDGLAPLGGVLVFALDADGNVVDQALTNAVGEYELTSLSPGHYQIQASAVGYADSAPVGSTLASGQTVSGVDLMLTAVAVTDVTVNPPGALNEIDANDLAPPPTFSLTEKEFKVLNAKYGSERCKRAQAKINFEIKTMAQTAYDASKALWDNTTSKNRAEVVRIDNESTTLRVLLDKQVEKLKARLDEAAEDYIARPDIIEDVRKALNQGEQPVHDQFNTFQNQYSAGNLAGAKQTLNILRTGDPAKPGQLPPFDGVKSAVTILGAALEKLANKQGSFTAKLKGDHVELAKRLAEFISAADRGSHIEEEGLKDVQAALDTIAKLETNANQLIRLVTTLEEYLAQLIDYKAKVDRLHKAIRTFHNACKACRIDPQLQPAPQGSGEAEIMEVSVPLMPVLAATSSETCPPASDSDLTYSALAAGENPPTCTCQTCQTINIAQGIWDVVPEDLLWLVGFPLRSSDDPNHKVGPAGFGAEGFIRPGVMPFTIAFENVPGANTIPAQEVFVTDTLDDDLDLSTLEFTGFGFGAFEFSVPAGLSHYETVLDLRPDGINLLVPVTLDINSETRVLSATFRSLDPLTGLLPDDIDAGFLPVNDATHVGEGFLSYLVRPKENLATGTEILNQASIVFDVNAPILTPQTRNTIDQIPPTSQVEALPATVASATFPVSWSGMDDAGGSGVVVFNVFVSVDGGPFVLWLDDTANTSDLYPGATGHMYHFYTVARDHAGWTELPPAIADAQTRVSTAPWRNPDDIFDVDDNGSVNISDVVAMVVFMRTNGIPFTLPDPGEGETPPPYIDLDANGVAAISDLLAEVQELRTRLAGGGEGESAAPEGEPVYVTDTARTATAAPRSQTRVDAAAPRIFQDESQLAAVQEHRRALDQIFGALKTARRRRTVPEITGKEIAAGDGSKLVKE